MNFTQTKIPDVVICETKIFGDSRGYFFESFREDTLEKFIGYKVKFCQDNESKSGYGVLRGLHYQLPPSAQTKLVRVVEGRVLDVVVDIRKGSKTFGEHVAVELSGDNKKQLFIPKGFAHGFVVLSETAIFSYRVDNYYNAERDRGIKFDDSRLNIDWKLNLNDIEISEKDKNQPSFENAEYFEI